MWDKLHDVSGYVGWSFLFSLIHTLFSPNTRTATTYAISFLASIPVGTLVGLYCAEHGIDASTTYVAVAISALTAQDLIKIVLAFSGFIQENRDSLFKKILRSMLKK